MKNNKITYKEIIHEGCPFSYEFIRTKNKIVIYGLTPTTIKILNRKIYRKIKNKA